MSVVYVDNPVVKNESAKHIVASEMIERVPGLSFVFNANEEKSYRLSFKGFLGWIGVYDWVKRVKPLSGRLSFIERYILSSLRSENEIVVFEDIVEDLSDKWAVFYEIYEPNLTRVQLNQQKSFPPVVVDKLSGEIEFVNVSEIAEMRIERREHKNKRSENAVGYSPSDNVRNKLDTPKLRKMLQENYAVSS